MTRELLKEWSFVFFDLGSNEAARRVRLLRGLRRVGAALRNQSVYCMPYSTGSFSSLKKLDKDICVVKADVEEDDIEEELEDLDEWDQEPDEDGDETWWGDFEPEYQEEEGWLE